MPGRDGMGPMGPMGQGAMTGRGMGWCGGADPRAELRPGGTGVGLGRGGGRGGGRGRGRGWRHRHGLQATGLTGWQRAQPGWSSQGDGVLPARSREQELAALMQQAEDIEHTLGELKSRIQELSMPEPDATGKEPR